MPFKNEAQRRALWAKDPELARKWTERYGSKPQDSEKALKRAARKRLLKHGRARHS